MGWLSSLTDSLFQGIKAVGKGVIEAAVPVVERVVAASQRLVRAIEEEIKNGEKPPTSERERLEGDLAEVNQRIQALRKRYRLQGSLSASDKKEVDRLVERRKELMADLSAIDRVDQAAAVVDPEQDFQALRIMDAQAHILQYHVGQQTFGKMCACCGRPMVLQWERGRTISATGEFFWGCSGYYMPHPRKCIHTEALTDADLQLFINIRRSEFELTPQDLAAYAELKNPTRVAAALQDIKAKTRGAGKGITGYRCPIHGETLLLREKNREAQSGILDQFFLGCPRWSRDKSGCNFFVKIKSAAQVSAVLEAGGEQALIATVESAAASGKPTKKGKRWLPTEDEILARAFDEGVTVQQLAKTLQRTEAAVEIRLSYLGKTPPPRVYPGWNLVDPI